MPNESIFDKLLGSSNTYVELKYRYYKCSQVNTIWSCSRHNTDSPIDPKDNTIIRLPNSLPQHFDDFIIQRFIQQKTVTK